MPDKLGRIVVPQPLRAYAGLDNEVVLAGVHSRVEIWQRQVWDEQQTAVDEDSSMIANTIAEQMASLGI
jgi:MraZ protein